MLAVIGFSCCSKDDNGSSGSDSEDTTKTIPLITFEPGDTTWKIRLTNPDTVQTRWRVDNDIWWLTCQVASRLVEWIH